MKRLITFSLFLLQAIKMIHFFYNASKKMSKYSHACDFLSLFFTILTTSEEFYSRKRISFQCNTCCTIQSLSIASYSNKRYKTNIKDFCIECKKKTENRIQTKYFIDEIEKSCGHHVKDVDFSTRKVIYECFTCQTEHSTFICNLQRSSNPGVCPSCQNNKHKVDFEYLQEVVTKHDMILITKKEEYKNNKQKLCLICKCGEPYEAVLSDIKRNKHCQTCKLSKYKQTCLDRYGEDNTSKVPSVYEKIVASSFSRKEFTFPISKRLICIMGYEPDAIIFLLERVLDPYLHIKLIEDHIIVGKHVQRFLYNDQDGIKHTYFPDMILNGTNHVIEVKSRYTFYRELLKNYLKFQAVVKAGCCLRLMIYNDKKVLNEYCCSSKEEIDTMFYTIDTINNLTQYTILKSSGIVV